MTTAVAAPTYPVPNRDFSVVFTLSQTGANWLRAWCTVAPDGSKLDGEIKKAAATNARADFYAGQGGPNHPLRTKLDKGGTYTLVLQEYRKGTGFGGGYEGDTRANQEETALGSPVTVTLDVGKRLTYPVGSDSDGATLALWVFGAYIRSTTVNLHGEASPAIIAAKSDRARTAAGSANVRTALAALVDVTASTAIGNVASVVGDIAAKFDAHIADGGNSVHNSPDTDNAIGTNIATAPTPQSLGEFVTKALQLFRQHMGNSDGAEATHYHKPASNDVADRLNVPLVRGVSKPEDAMAALGDLWRAFEGHRVSAVHTVTDTYHSLSALPPLLEVHRRFFAALASTAPTAAPGDASGAAILKAWGAKEA